MRSFFHPDQHDHDPKHFPAAGLAKPNPEQPARVEALLGALGRLGGTVETPAEVVLGGERAAYALRRPPGHHGNGRQSVFYARGDVLTVSVHTDPAGFYPFSWRHAHASGEGPGLGANRNRPISRGKGDQGFLVTVDRGLARIGAFGTDVLVIALGLDAYEGHPFAGLTFITPGLARMATAIVGLDLPSVIVQKGGHLCPELGANLESFLGADAP
ncbi:MAG: hypothetical protein AAFR79_06135 [Pseudomonadota bacterium]